jgi:hypothetical protein
MDKGYRSRTATKAIKATARQTVHTNRVAKSVSVTRRCLVLAMSDSNLMPVMALSRVQDFMESSLAGNTAVWPKTEHAQWLVKRTTMRPS